MTTKPIIHLDASALKIASCGRRFYLSTIKGYRSKLNSVEIEFGQAFHLTPKVFEESNGDFGKAYTASTDYFTNTPHFPTPKKGYLNKHFLADVCLKWMQEYYPQDSFDTLRDEHQNNKPSVEIKFSEHIYSSEHCDILLEGTMDRLAVHRTSKLLCVGDYKTTASWQMETYLNEYRLNPQLYVYILALKKMIARCSSDSVLAPFKGKDVGGFIDGVFVKSTGEVAFQRSNIILPSDKEMVEFEDMLLQFCCNIEGMINEIPAPTGKLLNLCKWCPFFNYCATENEDSRAHILSANFIQREYNPLNFSGTPTEE